ncbi:MAG: nitrate reductase maturation protein NarM [Synechococcaceae cyanobacterium RL_1_2]|nr:nitrate reductase maturation protein NarM [Synechococcaceae cyanobacterium RL_1_2]
MNEIFGFELDFSKSLRCIPMVVRCKLDTVGIKLKLDHWNSLSLEQRQALVDLDCDPHVVSTIAAYKEYVKNLVIASTGDAPKSIPVPNPLSWFDIMNIPPEVEAQVQHHEVMLTLKQWQKLSPLQRFALIKLSQPNHENKNFIPACEEFGLLPRFYADKN